VLASLANRGPYREDAVSLQRKASKIGWRKQKFRSGRPKNCSDEKDVRTNA
jgi:hypothetical protein